MTFAELLEKMGINEKQKYYRSRTTEADILRLRELINNEDYLKCAIEHIADKLTKKLEE